MFCFLFVTSTEALVHHLSFAYIYVTFAAALMPLLSLLLLSMFAVGDVVVVLALCNKSNNHYTRLG